MTFEEHLLHTRDSDGNFHLDQAEAARAVEIADELEGDPARREAVAKKAAQNERNAWRRQQQNHLTKVVQQPALSQELAAIAGDAKVQLGNNEVRSYLEMDSVRIRQRMDMRERVHRGEQRAYVTEQDHWDQTLALLDGDSTIGEALGG